MEKPDVKTIIKAVTPTKIPYMDNPPAKGGEIKYLTPQEFKAKFKCEYTEGVVVKSTKNKQLASEADFQNVRAKAAYERLLNPLDSLVICKMSDKVGYGLFTTKHIPIGTVICLYAGEYAPSSEEIIYSCGTIDAAKYGGFARFMQHQPISKETHLGYLMQGLQDHRLFAIHENVSFEIAKNLLADPAFIAKKTEQYRKEVTKNATWGDYNFTKNAFTDKEFADNVAQSNIFYEIAEVAGVDVVCMIAMCDIKANESIGFSYGPMYWRHPSIENSPRLFTKYGDIISRSLLESVIVSSSEESKDDDHEPYHNENYMNAYSNPTEKLTQLIEKLKSIPDFNNLSNNNPTTNPNIQNITSNITSLENKQEVLQKHTDKLFKHSIDAQWKKYPQQSLVGKYVGHQVQFFTMPLNRAEEAKKFTQQLKNVGFDAELKTANKKPSVVVDLTASKLNFM